ncbi:hypothetical protein [Streptomyces sp. NPDC055752]
MAIWSSTLSLPTSRMRSARADVDGGGAQVEAGQELVGEVDLRGGLVGGVERDGECALGLVVGGFAGLAVLRLQGQSPPSTTARPRTR